MPTLRIIKLGAALKKYKFEGDFKALDAGLVSKFVGDFKHGTLAPHYKSAAVPESNDDPVKIVVGSEWEKIVKDETKDVLIAYTAPWCGHCQRLAPNWEILGEQVKDLDDLVIANMDSTANEVEGVEIKSYPTLKWYPKGNKAGEDYTGERILPAIEEFLMKNSESYAAMFPKEEAPKEEAPKAEAVKSEEL